MIVAGDKVVVRAGCLPLGVRIHETAIVQSTESLGADYSHQARVRLRFGTRLVSLYARHPNRLADDIVSLNDGDPFHNVRILRLA